MNPFLSVLMLLGLAAGIGMIVLVPALIEWRRPRDLRPIAIDSSFVKRDTFFADRFRAVATPWWDAAASQNPEAKRAAALAESLECSPSTRLDEEAWARRDIRLGAGCQARALLAEQDVILERGCKIARWIHADRDVLMGEGGEALARVTAGRSIRLAGACRTPLLSAPDIVWEGAAQEIPLETPTHARRWLRRVKVPEAGKTWDIPRKRTRANGTVFVHGDLILDSEADIDFPLVVLGNLYIRHGALIAGDIKAWGDLLVEGSGVIGNLVCRGRLVIGGGSTVQGCLRGDELVWLGDGVIVGSPDSPEAVVGSQVVLTGRGTVHGRISSLDGFVEVAG